MAKFITVFSDPEKNSVSLINLHTVTRIASYTHDYRGGAKGAIIYFLDGDAKYYACFSTIDEIADEIARAEQCLT